MSVSHSIPATVEIRRGRLFGLVAAVAVLAAAVTWILVARAFDSGSSTPTAVTAPAVQGYMSYFGPHPATATDTPAPFSLGTAIADYQAANSQPFSLGTAIADYQAANSQPFSLGTAIADYQRNSQAFSLSTAIAPYQRENPSIMSLTPAGLAANALGTGYALPSAQKGPSVESVLESMSPQTREYTKRIMNLTFARLAAGAAGQP
jgi:hypothetical protein